MIGLWLSRCRRSTFEHRNRPITFKPTSERYKAIAQSRNATANPFRLSVCLSVCPSSSSSSSSQIPAESSAHDASVPGELWAQRDQPALECIKWAGLRHSGGETVPDWNCPMNQSTWGGLMRSVSRLNYPQTADFFRNLFMPPGIG